MTILVLPRTLDASVSALPKVKGPAVKRLEKPGLPTIRDLLLTLPFDWEAYGAPANVAQLVPGRQASEIGTIVAISAKVTLRRRMKLTEATVRDDSGVGLKLVWFNQPFIAKQLHKGDRVAVAGTVKEAKYSSMLEMQNPHHEVLEDTDDYVPTRVGGMMPKYHLVAGLSSRKLAGWVESALPLAGEPEELLPASVRERHALVGVAEAVRMGHRADTEEQWNQ